MAVKHSFALGQILSGCVEPLLFLIEVCGWHAALKVASLWWSIVEVQVVIMMGLQVADWFLRIVSPFDADCCVVADEMDTLVKQREELKRELQAKLGEDASSGEEKEEREESPEEKEEEEGDEEMKKSPSPEVRSRSERRRVLDKTPPARKCLCCSFVATLQQNHGP